MLKFKKKNTYEKRKFESERITNKYKDQVPIIVEVSDANSHELTLDKAKYLVPFDLTIGQFIYVIRKRLLLEPEKALFIFVNNTLPPTFDTVGNLYKNHKDPDGFLYLVISLESTFG